MNGRTARNVLAEQVASPVHAARKARKISSFNEEAQVEHVVTGDRTKTEFGFTAAVHDSESFSTYYAHFMPGSTSHKYANKSAGVRVYQCLSGAGVIVSEKDDVITETAVASGSSFVVRPETLFHVTAAVTDSLRFFVSESVDFSDSLVVVTASAEVEVPSDLLAQVRPNAPLPIREITKNDKAIMNLMADRMDRQRRSGTSNVNMSAGSSELQRLMDAAQGIDTSDA